MPLVYSAAASHAPGITARRHTVTDGKADSFFRAMDQIRQEIEEAQLDALVIISAEHFTNFFMDHMPAFCVGTADSYAGPVEDEDFLRIPKTTVPGASDLGTRLCQRMLHDVDLSFAQELKLDHGFMVPLHFLTPSMDLPVIPIIINCLQAPFASLERCVELGRSLRRAVDEMPERIGLLGAGGISHWPAAPRSGEINEEWDFEFVQRFAENNISALTSYSDEEIVESGGPGGHEIRAWIAVAGATEGQTGTILTYTPVPEFAIGCTAVVVNG